MLRAMWEIEAGPESSRSFDVLLNGRPQHLGLDAEQVRDFFDSRNVDLSDVEGHQLLK